MAKNYKETTTQAAVLRTSTKTLSFWCNIREAPLERFAELIEGNIRIALQDFSGGKGDKSKFAYFNLEISDIYEIKDCMQAKNPFRSENLWQTPRNRWSVQRNVQVLPFCAAVHRKSSKWRTESKPILSVHKKWICSGGSWTDCRIILRKKRDFSGRSCCVYPVKRKRSEESFTESD